MIWGLLPRKTRFRRSSKGISTVIGTIFLVIIALTVATNVFLWTLTQNTTYFQAVKESNQMEADRSGERVVAYDTVYSVSPDEVEVTTTMTAQGALSAQIIKVWVTYTDESDTKYSSKTVDFNLTPGDPITRTINVNVPGALAVDNGWLVTARGNRVPLEQKKVITVASVAEGIGSISMNFDTFSYYELSGNPSTYTPSVGTDIGSVQHSFTLPGDVYTIFAIELTNLDESGKDIILSESSCIWLLAPPDSMGAVKLDTWFITRVVDNKLASFTPKVLEYDTATTVYFGPWWGKSTSDTITAVNILLFGEIGEIDAEDYGQNIPFISIYVTG